MIQMSQAPTGLDGELDAEMTSAQMQFAILQLSRNAGHACSSRCSADVDIFSEVRIRPHNKCAQALYYFSAQRENHAGMFGALLRSHKRHTFSLVQKLCGYVEPCCLPLLVTKMLGLKSLLTMVL